MSFDCLIHFTKTTSHFTPRVTGFGPVRDRFRRFDVKRFSEAFSLFDTERSGAIDARELKATALDATGARSRSDDRLEVEKAGESDKQLSDVGMRKKTVFPMGPTNCRFGTMNCPSKRGQCIAEL